MKGIYNFIYLILLTNSCLLSQNLVISSSSHTNDIFKKSSPYIFPTGCILYGVASLKSNQLRSWDYSLRDWSQSKINQKHSFDDVTAMLPMAAFVGLKFANLESRSSCKQYFISGMSACAIQFGLVFGIKHLVQRIRPDQSNHFSFPSGHTSLAFAGAELLRIEYSNPWIVYSAYSLAGVTAGMRIINNRHWFSDVVMGAGIGYLSARLGKSISSCSFNSSNHKLSKQSKNEIHSF